jgi:hypothetical protein
MSTYRVTFDRVGRNHDVAPFEAEVVHLEDLAERIYKHARPHLRSRDVEVVVDEEEMHGWILCGFNNGGTFTIERTGGAS